MTLHDIGVLQTIATVLASTTFVGIAWWAYAPTNRKRFEQDGQLALLDDPMTPHQVDVAPLLKPNSTNSSEIK